MVKALVTVNLPGVSEEDIKESGFILPDGRISIDEAFLQRDPTDDSFYAFELVDILTIAFYWPSSYRDEPIIAVEEGDDDIPQPHEIERGLPDPTDWAEDEGEEVVDLEGDTLEAILVAIRKAFGDETAKRVGHGLSLLPHNELTPENALQEVAIDLVCVAVRSVFGDVIADEVEENLESPSPDGVQEAVSKLRVEIERSSFVVNLPPAEVVDPDA